jgi:hypothetical protein
MSETPHIPDAPSPATARAAERLGMLRELAEIGMAHARAIGRRLEADEAQAGAESDPADARALRDAGLTFPRIARAVRQTLALEARLEAEFLAGVRQAETAQQVRLSLEAYAPISRRSDLVRRAVSQAIDADTVDGAQEEALLESLDEQLDEREDAADYLDRPISELVAAICRDLGVPCNHRLWEDEDWFKEEAEAKAAAAETPEPLPPAGRSWGGGASCESGHWSPEPPS